MAHYAKTVAKEATREELDGVMMRRANALPSKNDMIILRNKTYSELFEKIVKCLVENILKRVAGLQMAKAPKKDRSILFQLIGSLNLMHPSELIHEKLLGNFLESNQSFEALERILFVDKACIDQELVDCPLTPGPP